VFLVQFFEWVMGEPNAMAVVSLDEMLWRFNCPRDRRQWVFFADEEHLQDWMERARMHD